MRRKRARWETLQPLASAALKLALPPGARMKVKSSRGMLTSWPGSCRSRQSQLRHLMQGFSSRAR